MQAVYEGIRLQSTCAVSILRGGDAIMTVAREMLSCAAGHILIQRDENARAQHMFTKLPTDIANLTSVLLCDPMIATGNSVKKAIKCLADAGVQSERIILVSMIACREGIEAVNTEYPNVRIITCAVDPILNEKSYIIPGLGDFGDRYCA